MYSGVGGHAANAFNPGGCNRFLCYLPAPPSCGRWQGYIGLRLENTGPHSSRARRCQTRSASTSRLSAPCRCREAPEAPLEAGDNGTNSRRCGLSQLRARVLGEVRSFHKRPAPSGVVTHTAAVAGRTFSILAPPSCRQSRTSQQSMALGTTPFSATMRGPWSVRNVTITTLVSACYGFEPVEACVWTQEHVRHVRLRVPRALPQLPVMQSPPP